MHSKQVKIFKPEDIIQFGRNRGFSLSEIYKYQPGYLEWIVLHTESYALDIECFRMLPDPTPYHHVNDSERNDLRNKKGLVSVFISDGKSRESLRFIKERVAEGLTLAAIAYSFPDDVVEANLRKIAKNRTPSYETTNFYGYGMDHEEFDDQECPRCQESPCICSDPEAE